MSFKKSLNEEIEQTIIVEYKNKRDLKCLFSNWQPTDIEDIYNKPLDLPNRLGLLGNRTEIVSKTDEYIYVRIKIKATIVTYFSLLIFTAGSIKLFNILNSLSEKMSAFFLIIAFGYGYWSEMKGWYFKSISSEIYRKLYENSIKD